MRDTVSDYLTLGELADRRGLLIVHCTHCKRTKTFPAKTMLEGMGRSKYVLGIRFRCMRCHRRGYKAKPFVPY